jgi:DNA-binding protein H-NS
LRGDVEMAAQLPLLARARDLAELRHLAEQAITSKVERLPCDNVHAGGHGKPEAISRLHRLLNVITENTTRSALGRGGARGSVAPKYRNPQNPSETWAGRGLKPRWLAAAIKTGKKMDDFLIAGASPSPKTNGRRKVRKARK